MRCQYIGVGEAIKMIRCSQQCLICDFPIHLDTYQGCSHKCEYCFAKVKGERAIKPINQKWAVKRFIEGHRNSETRWCDWNIPIHWGGNSDPFQACETVYKKSLECLEVFAETKHPIIISTKNPVLATTEPYLSLLKQCRCVFQISMCCDSHDKREPGAPPYRERLKAAAILSKNVTRVIARLQPFYIQDYNDVMHELQNYKNAGIYGILIEGYYCTRKADTVEGMEKDGSKYGFPIWRLAPMFKAIKAKCHEVGLRFFCGEDQLRFLSDDLACCGTENLPDFIPNKFNVEHLAHDEENAKPTFAMQMADTAGCFGGIRQTAEFRKNLKNKSFEQAMFEHGQDYIDYYEYLRHIYGDDE